MFPLAWFFLSDNATSRDDQTAGGHAGVLHVVTFETTKFQRLNGPSKQGLRGHRF
jgi:hypothetical protein